jgi:hypothetical protein
VPLERSRPAVSIIDVLDRVIDKGIIFDAHLPLAAISIVGAAVRFSVSSASSIDSHRHDAHRDFAIAPATRREHLDRTVRSANRRKVHTPS